MEGRGTLCVVAVAGLLSLSAEPVAQRLGQTRRIVRQVDHLLIESDDPARLFSLLSDTLQLPVAWPITDNGRFLTGGVAAGNIDLEVLKASGSRIGDVRSRWVGFALEPEPLSTSLSALQARGIPHGSPAPFTTKGPNGSVVTLWTTVGLPRVSRDDVRVFLTQYEHDVSARRRQLLDALRSRKGGPLGVRSVREIVYGATDSPALQEDWQALLNPLESSSPGVWALGTGPAIRLVSAAEDGIRGIVMNVESLPRARRFLMEQRLWGSERPGELTLAAPELGSLNVTLVEGGV
jgi:hypothetical protein